MANVRPPRKSKNARVDDEIEEPERPTSHVGDGRPAGRSFFLDDYDQMHSRSFNGNGDTNTFGMTGSNKIKGPKGGTLESLVTTLASLQFTTKGKIDADGKFELVFCSPEPIVVEEKPKPEVRFIEPILPPERKSSGHKHRRSKRRFLM